MEWLSKSTKRLLAEMSAGIIFYNMILVILALVMLPRVSYPVVPVVLGLVVGAVGAICMLIHMAVTTERVLDSKSESYANKYTVAQGMLRKLVLVAAFLICWEVLKIDLLAAVIGAMGMKAGAYLQPLVHRISAGKEPEASAQADTSDNDRPGIS
ncbi:hypothetical protein [Lacrimispora indolis]|uniref:hypothetical protein n=1 Tax=Lacrimispora indolis TaxID=69825 RepID=UPI003564562E